MLISKVALIWLGIAVLAVANGFIREFIVAPKFGMQIALPLSGVTLSILVFIAAFYAFGFFGVRNRSTCLLIGAQWVLMTLAFEFLFGHYVAGKPWSVLVQNFNILKGDLFTLVLIVTFLSPYLVGRIRGAF